MIRLTAVIEIENQAPRALTHESTARSFIIGRDAQADFQLPLGTISRQHARIEEADNVYTIEDLGSTHGTRINGKILAAGQKKVLRSGDTIEMSRAQISCHIEWERVVKAEPNEPTQAIAARAVQGILGRLGDPMHEGPFLRILSGVDHDRKYPLAAPSSEWTLGRSSDCECVLQDPNVSRRHAQIKRDWNGFILHDLGSKNGVLLNDQRLQRPRRLNDQDEITIGPVRLVFVDPDAELLSALKDVPGFDVASDEISSEMPAGQDDAADVAESGASEHDEPADDSGPAGLPDADADGQGDAALDELDLDPELLETLTPRLPIDWIVLAGVAILGLVAIIALVALAS